METLTVKDGSNVINEYGIPETWKDVPEKKRLQSLRICLGMEYPYNWASICKKIIGLKAKELNAIPAVQLWDLYESLKWMSNEPVTEPVVSSFKHNGTTYYLPAEKLWNASAIEFAIADEYYTQFADSKEPDKLLFLLATLARPEDPDKPRHKKLEDKRIPLMNREEAEERAQDLAGVDPAYIHIAFLYFTGCKKWIHDTYGQYIFNEDGESEKDPLGWWGTFMRLAETGVFGDFDETVQKPIHNILQYLMKNSMDHERMKKKMKKK